MLSFLFRRKWTLMAGFFAARYAYKMWQQNPEFQRQVRNAIPQGLKDAIPNSMGELKASMGQVAQHNQPQTHH